MKNNPNLELQYYELHIFQMKSKRTPKSHETITFNECVLFIRLLLFCLNCLNDRKIQRK
jgi:hypothetical protein